MLLTALLHWSCRILQSNFSHLLNYRSPLNPFNTNIPSAGAQPVRGSQPVKKKTIIKAEPQLVKIKREPGTLPRPNIPLEDAVDEVDGMDVGVGSVKTEKDSDTGFIQSYGGQAYTYYYHCNLIWCASSCQVDRNGSSYQTISCHWEVLILVMCFLSCNLLSESYRTAYMD